MSFYLNHIAALSLNLVQPLQPRLPNLFESAPEINHAANEPAEIPNHDAITPGQKNHTEPLAQANHPAPKPIPADHSASLAEQNQRAVPLQAHEAQKANLGIPEQNNTPLPNIIEAAETNKPVITQPAATIKAADASPVTQPEQRYKPAVEKIIEHTIVERTLIGRSGDITPVATNHKDSTEHTKQSTSGKPIPSVAADAPVAPKTKQQQPVADLKPAISVIAHGKSMLEPRIQARTPPKETPKTEALGKTHTEPTIQVSIGRIEIRATQNTDRSPSKPRPASATLSLDDYLKQRNGGRS